MFYSVTIVPCAELLVTGHRYQCILHVHVGQNGEIVIELCVRGHNNLCSCLGLLPG